MHWHIEMFLNGLQIQEPHSPEFVQFMVLFEKLGLKPFRTELCVYHSGPRGYALTNCLVYDGCIFAFPFKGLDVAGQIDCLCKGERGLEIWDWKRSKEIQMDAFRQLKFPLHHLPGSNFYHYAIQLNIYRHILESEYETPISRMCLGVFHPSSECATCVEIPRMETEIDLILDFEKRAFAQPLWPERLWKCRHNFFTIRLRRRASSLPRKPRSSLPL